MQNRAVFLRELNFMNRICLVDYCPVLQLSSMNLCKLALKMFNEDFEMLNYRKKPKYIRPILI